MKEALAQLIPQIDAFIESNLPDRILPPYLNEAVAHLVKAGGKRLRPALVHWFCQLYGGSSEQAMPAAAALEIFHTWTLVHDDIIDEDQMRRGYPTTHKQLEEFANSEYKTNRSAQFGEAMAILTGDLQQAWVQQLLCKLPAHGVSAEITLAIIERLNTHLTPLLISGEALDVEFEYRAAENADEIIKMMTLKTGALLEFCAQVGVMLGKQTADFNDPDVKRAGELMRAGGLVFQLQDDILGVFGDEIEFGKPLGSDLTSGKETLLMHYSRQNTTEEALTQLDSYQEKEVLDADELNEARMIIFNSGGMEHIHSLMGHMLGHINQQINQLPNNTFRSYIHEVIELFVNRKN